MFASKDGKEIDEMLELKVRVGQEKVGRLTYELIE